MKSNRTTDSTLKSSIAVKRRRAPSQLRLLLWKNFLQQIRSPWFTVFELFIPFLLIGLSFGLMIGLRKNFERSHNATHYPSWIVTGSAMDLILPPDFTNITGTIVDPLIFLRESKLGDCTFLNVTKDHDDPQHFHIKLEIVYAPITNRIDHVMNLVKNRYTSNDILDLIKNSDSDIPFINYLKNFTISSEAIITGKTTEAELVDYMVKSLSSACSNPIIGGIVFDKQHGPYLNSEHYSYKIRLSNTKRRFKDLIFGQYLPWDTRFNYAIQLISGPIDPPDAGGGDPGYWQEGFLTLQKAVDYAMFNITSSGELWYQTFVKMQRFPFPPYNNKIIEVGCFFLGVVIIFSFLPSVIYTVRSVVIEKEDRIKEYMRVMGLSQWIYWLAFFIINYAKLLIMVIVISVLLHFVADKSDPTVAFVFLLLYAFDTVYFAFALSTFMQSGTAATLLAVLGWMLLYFWTSLFNGLDILSQYSFAIRLINCLNPDVALSFASQLLARYEIQASGYQWSTLFETATPDEQITIGHLFVMLIVDGIILVLLTWYLEAVNPGGEGRPEKLYFFLLPSYWFSSRSEKKKFANKLDNGFMENPPSSINCQDCKQGITIDIVNLSKTYGESFSKKLFNCKFGDSSVKKAVNCLNLKIYDGQLTALLGHNGAGKSTTFSMLTGVTVPTSGTAFINGLNIRNSLPEIRTTLGLCPQYNILFGILTVMEHLEFFCKLKGRQWSNEEANELIKNLKFEYQANTPARFLSGGQKRKLSLAIALIGGSEVIMLDEPTSGMDPGARHETWMLLQREKKKRTILLTTHYMEEADLLGDRIAILANGELECYGSSMDLKRKYGSGYHLTIVFKNANENATQEENLKKTENLLKTNCHNAQMLTTAGQEATFALPTENDKKLSELFSKLEEKSSECGISSFGVSITTMEEVFLKVNQLSEEKRQRKLTKSYSNCEQNTAAKILSQQIHCNERISGFGYLLQQIEAMLIKRCIYFFRRWTQFIPQLLIPVLFMALLVWSACAVPSVKVQSPQAITLDSYFHDGKPVNIFVLNASLSYWGNNLPDSIEKVVGKDYRRESFQISAVENVSSAILERSVEEGTRGFGIHNPIAFVFSSEYLFDFHIDTLIALFNNFGRTAAPLALNIADITLLRLITKRNISIQVTNHPLPPTSSDSLKGSGSGFNNGPAMIIGYAIIVSMSMVVSGYSCFIIRERSKKSRHMQIMSGLHPAIYWMTAFIWDAFCFLLPTGLFIVIYVAFDIKAYIERADVILTLVFVMLLYGWAQIPFVYLLSFVFTSASKGYSVLVVYMVTTGMIGAIVIPILEQTTSGNIANICSILFALIFPTYNLNSCFIKIYGNEYSRQACAMMDCSLQKIGVDMNICCGIASERIYAENVLTEIGNKGILLRVIFLCIEGFLFWIVLIAVESGLFRKLANYFQKETRNIEPIIKEEDIDIQMERTTVKNLDYRTTPIVVKELTKWYGKFNAVRGVNFHVDVGDCFGLLGVNGAGKTSTFQMLTGENNISHGDAWFQGSSVFENWRKATMQLGYCPQFDAIINEMTGKETLTMYARIRGIRRKYIPSIVKNVIEAIGIRIYANRLIKTYSGGNKRRLSLGIAVVGLPQILLLDEPTTGVDPQARRIIWNILSTIREMGTALLLTSHSMEECEALCTKIAIMYAGRFKCIGTAQHIKSKYVAGCNLLLRVKSLENIANIKTATLKTFPGAILKEQHLSQLHYEINRNKELTWSQLFERTEKLIEEYDIVDYSLSQPTLEQVFLELSRDDAQLEETTAKIVNKLNKNSYPFESNETFVSNGS